MQWSTNNHLLSKFKLPLLFLTFRGGVYYIIEMWQEGDLINYSQNEAICLQRLIRTYYGASTIDFHTFLAEFFR